MTSLASLGDGAAVANFYQDRIIVMVEGSGDLNAFQRILGTGFDADLMFKVAPTPNGKGGCQAVRDRVAEERQQNDKVFGLLDGEAAAVLEGTRTLYESEEELFKLPDNEGLIFLSVHEIENLYFAHADVCGAIAHHKPLAKLAFTPANVATTLDENIDRYWGAACYKYASAHFYARNQMNSLISTKIFDEDPLRAILKVLRLMVVGNGTVTWNAFKRKARELREAGAALVAGRGYGSVEEKAWKLRVADGKELLRRLRRLNGNVGDAVEGHLLKEVCDGPYPAAFRQRLFDLLNYHAD